MKKLILIIISILVPIDQVLAGPGGRFARELFDGPLSRIVGIIFIVILLPLAVRFYHKRTKAVRDTKDKLKQLSRIDNALFDEVDLKNRVTDVFERVHKAWAEKDLRDCEEYMTSWYRQNQQSVYLDEWDRKGLINVCTIREISGMKPIHLRLTESKNFEGSRIMYSIDAYMEDYLVQVENSSVLEGKKGFRHIETVWTLKLEGGIWKVDNIEQSEMVSSYLKMDSDQTDGIIQRLIGDS